ncbi:hypothetical protein DPMN_060256 [Dreissena polymorpha]|uniref:Uncharacterized protein n=1 Tax=Dreissena polymorpha TaxID=45954 RepID=A0A9D4HHE1_DREPO|nr:hypothetical protein DPMN_060256 [Dreissena polymorpha]
MYITSGTALFHYNRDGKPVKKLYENLGAGDKGQVLVCWKNNIIQVDSEGKRKISILAIPNVDYPSYRVI